MPLLQITDASGRNWHYPLTPDVRCTIGRATDNCVTLDDPRASRYHAFIRHEAGTYILVDGALVGAELKRSINKVLVNGQPHAEHRLKDGDQIVIGASRLQFVETKAER
ncbi:MAG TPA: FHA domain-containing protein, partial [Pyrinomonadaceae bacterium]|nr:FHA domain-containing protein [Pyrinomonadaceae bacterium]